MAVKLRSPQDFGAGLIFGLAGAVGLWFAQDYTIGSAARMGPGYFPVLLSLSLLLIAGILLVRSLRLDGPAVGRTAWLANTVIIASIVVFGLLIERVGLVATVFATVTLASLAYGEARWREILPLALLMAVLTVGIVVFILKQPLSIWGTWWMS